tara:strand:- start:274 stop:954 length:681 start_codon:yes stop_codon:yes gene_type:complete
MGNRRMGLGRMEALLEAVDRDLNLANTTLTNCTITTDQVATFTNSVKSVGGLAPSNSVGAICNALAISADGFGMYEVLFEVDFGGYTATATDNGLIKTAITIPTDSMIIGGSAMTTEVVGQNNTSTIDLVSATTAHTDTADEAVTAVLTIIDGADFKSSSLGALGSFLPMVYANDTVHHIGSTGTSTTLAWINKGTGNGTSAYSSGKIMVYLKYLGSGPAVADTRV